MSISPGFTALEIREFVYDYHRQPYGQKRVWLAARGIPYHRLKRWRLSVFDGDLDRGLIPREGMDMTSAPARRAALARIASAEQTEAELARLRARVHELEQTNEALGKAIGLLHARSEQEPDATPTTNDLSSSSTGKTNSLSS